MLKKGSISRTTHVHIELKTQKFNRQDGVEYNRGPVEKGGYITRNIDKRGVEKG